MLDHATKWAEINFHSIILKYIRGFSIEWDHNDVPEQEIVPKPLYFSQDEQKFLEVEAILELLDLPEIRNVVYLFGV